MDEQILETSIPAIHTLSSLVSPVLVNFEEKVSMRSLVKMYEMCFKANANKSAAISELKRRTMGNQQSGAGGGAGKVIRKKSQIRKHKSKKGGTEKVIHQQN